MLMINIYIAKQTVRFIHHPRVRTHMCYYVIGINHEFCIQAHKREITSDENQILSSLSNTDL